MRKANLILMLIITIITSGCKTMTIEDYADSQPELVLSDYFVGTTKAWGIFQDRSGQVKRQFVVTIEGSMKDDELVLVEDFVYADGSTDQRIWRIRTLSDGIYEGRADDVIGTASGIAKGNALNWSYTLALPYKDSTVNVQFDDWMFLQEDGVLINRAKMKKFGFTLGEVTLFFKRDESGE